jgi:putative phosphoesterase
LDALDGCELIIHAGDIGQPEILERLREIAPLITVRGNIDKGDWADALPRTAVVEVRSSLIYVIHDIHELDLDPAAASFRMVVSGHSHKPSRTERNGVIYLNPGSAGPRRFSLPISLARVDVTQSPWAVNLVEL